MGIKIHEYANEAFQINDEDFYDVDYWNGASYESRKISGATLKAELSGGSGGRFGIADTNGVYTYYTTLTAAMTAAVSGQTIEVFADYTETGATEITIKNGVNINGNGHTFTKNTNDATHILITANSLNYECSIINYNFIRSVGSGRCMNTGINNTGRIDFTGTTFKNTGTGKAAEISGIDVLNLTGISTSSAAALTFLGNKIKGVVGINTSSGVGLQLFGNGVTAELCSGESNSGIGFYCDGRSLNCTGYSVSAEGFFTLNFSQNCTGRSISGTGFVTFYDTNEVLNCVGTSVSGIGFSSQGGNASGCSGLSQSNYGTLLNGGLARHYNFYSTSYGAPAIWALNSGGTQYIVNGSLYCRWNNAAGYGIRGWGGIMPSLISNVFFKLVNASAPYLFNDGLAASVSLRGNTYQGGAVYNANITQSVVATEDNQGNIFL